MEEDEWIWGGIEFQMKGAAERKEREPKFVLFEVGGRGDSAGRRSAENG
jgi:hypothetical protein